MSIVCVIIHTYNNEKYIGETIDSVLRQTYKNYEIDFIVDTHGLQSVVLCRFATV